MGMIPADTSAPGLSLGLVLEALRRHRWLVGTCFLAIMALATIAIFHLQPSYRATALVALGTRQVQISEVSSVVSDPLNVLDSAVARSEVEILASGSLARQVVEDLRLQNDPEFAAPPSRLAQVAAAAAMLAARIGGPLKPLAEKLQAIGAGSPLETPAERINAVVDRYEHQLSVDNDGRSYVVNVSFEASDPALAARIVNRHVELYIENQRRSKDKTLRSATRWLDQEVVNLAARLRQAEAKVQAYREQYHLSAPGTPAHSQQQLLDIGHELALARADLAQRDARLHEALHARSAGGLTEIANSDVIARLREQEVVARGRLADAEATLGPKHPALASLKAEVVDIQGMIAHEQERILNSLQSEAIIASNRVSALRGIVSELEDRMTQADRDEAGARDLEREASAIQVLYQSLLSRQKQVATQIGIQQADAQVVSAASVPEAPYFPNRSLLLSVSLIVAFASAVGAALALDYRRRGLESLDEVTTTTGLRRVVALPGVSPGWLGRATARMALPDQVATQPRSVAAEFGPLAAQHARAAGSQPSASACGHLLAAWRGQDQRGPGAGAQSGRVGTPRPVCGRRSAPPDPGTAERRLVGGRARDSRCAGRPSVLGRGGDLGPRQSCAHAARCRNGERAPGPPDGSTVRPVDRHR